MSDPKLPLKSCANGCDAKPDPPSLVICRPCQDRITRKLESMLNPNPRRGEP